MPIYALNVVSSHLITGAPAPAPAPAFRPTTVIPPQRFYSAPLPRPAPVPAPAPAAPVRQRPTKQQLLLKMSLEQRRTLKSAEISITRAISRQMTAAKCGGKHSSMMIASVKVENVTLETARCVACICLAVVGCSERKHACACAQVPAERLDGAGREPVEVGLDDGQGAPSLAAGCVGEVEIIRHRRLGWLPSPQCVDEKPAESAVMAMPPAVAVLRRRPEGDQHLTISFHTAMLHQVWRLA